MVYVPSLKAIASALACGPTAPPRNLLFVALFSCISR
jgi:hypothetical protein